MILASDSLRKPLPESTLHLFNMNPLDAYFDGIQDEARRELMLYVRRHLRASPHLLEERYAWRIPVYYRAGRYVCYLYEDVKNRRGYLAFVRGTTFRHPLLLAEGRRQVRILVLDPTQDAPVEAIEQVLAQAYAALE